MDSATLDKLNARRAASRERLARDIARQAKKQKPHVFKLETDEQKATARLVRDSKRRMKSTNLGKLQALQAERERWERKQTIATNKLRAVRRQIEALAETMARATMGNEWEGGTK